MKFQKLTIHNMASIEDATINFEDHPLVDSEVFLITGKTGSGKSTILDAICLALYADTPRLENTNMQGETKDGEREVKINDPRQLMRRNTGEAFVKLAFIGSNGVHYEAIWSVARARSKATGNLQSKHWELRNCDNGMVLSRDREIESEIKMAIGLDFNQFCRTTMLAQGEFTRFLNSKDDEKAQILEKITGVDIYSKIGAKVYSLTAEKQLIMTKAQQKIEGINTLSEKSIGEKNDELVKLEQQCETLRSAMAVDGMKRDWIKTDYKLAEEVGKAKEALQEAKKVVEEDDFKEKKSLVDEWNLTNEARSMLKEAQEAKKTIQIQDDELKQGEIVFNQLLGGQEFIIQEIEKLNEDLRKIEANLELESVKVSIYEKAQTIVEQLKRIIEGRHNINNHKDKIEKNRKSLSETLQPALDEAKNEAAKFNESFEKEESDVKDREQKVADLNLSDLRTQRDQINEMLDDIKHAKDLIEALAAAKEQRETTQKNLTQRLEELEGKKKELEAKEKPIREAKIKMDDRKELIEKQRDTIDKFSKTLRSKLHVGDTCPICRQKIAQELPHEEELDQLINGLNEAYNEAKKVYDDLEGERTKLEAEIKAESDSYLRDKKTFDSDMTLMTKEQKAQEACEKCQMVLSDINVIQRLEEKKNQAETSKTELDGKIAAGEKDDQDVKNLRKSLELKRPNLKIIVDKVSNAEKAVNDCNNWISTSRTLVEEETKKVHDAEQGVKDLIGEVKFEIDWNVCPKRFAEALVEAANKYKNQIEERRSLKTRIENLGITNKNVADVIDGIVDFMPLWKSLQPTVVSKMDSLLKDANSLSNKISSALKQKREAENTYSTSMKWIETFLEKNPSLSIDRLIELKNILSEEINKKNQELDDAKNAVARKEELYNNAEEKQKEHQETKPALTEGDNLEAILSRINDDEQQITAINEKRGGICQELNTDKENKKRLGELIHDFEKKKEEYHKWSNLNQLIGSADGSKFRKIAQSYVLTSLIHSANSYMRTLSDRYVLKVIPGTFVISLEDSYQGYASRAASTLSGGESFLVSLSLALALSDIGQTFSVDTLFIDEGFGTLSGEPLQNAINTLRSLHVKAGRHVGIISHIEELKERIPVQIQVNQEGNSSSSIVEVKVL